MAIIYETQSFMLVPHPRPEIDRLEGGHLKIVPKKDIIDRANLTPRQAIELQRLTIVAGLAMKTAMAKQGVKIGRINYQDNGNWIPHFHIHLYGRALDAKVQKYGDPFRPGHDARFKPLNAMDIKLIHDEMDKLFAKKEYSDEDWFLK